MQGFLRPPNKDVAVRFTLLLNNQLLQLKMRYGLLIILSFLSIFSYAQNFVVNENDSTVVTEYNDGRLWAYRHVNDYVVGLTCYEAKDDYGKYYQVMVFIKNLSAQNITFEPNEINSYLVKKNNDTIPLQVYTNEEFQKKVKRSQNWAMALYGFSAGLNAGSAGYSTSYSTTYSPNGYAYTTMTTHYNPNAAYQANVAASTQMMTLGKLMEDERVTKEQGYLKKTTIHINEGIIGYMNIKRKKGNKLIINIPINEYTYSFEWDVNIKKN